MRLILLLLVGSLAWAAEPFPTTSGENLLGAKMSLPEAAKGHTAVVVIGFTHASQKQTQPWTARLGQDYGGWCIAVIEDAPRLVRGMAISGIRGTIPKERREHFLIVTAGETQLKEAAQFSQPDDAYLLLLDKDGAVQWRFHGPLTEAAFTELKKRAAELDAPR